MSILQEYETIRKQLGEKEYSDICKYLDTHENKELYLSDVYYKKSVFDEFKKWQTKQNEKRELSEIKCTVELVVDNEIIDTWTI